jgi:hypothetical protein
MSTMSFGKAAARFPLHDNAVMMPDARSNGVGIHTQYTLGRLAPH